MTSQMTPQRSQYKVVGTRPKRRDAVDKVTGRALFGADMQLPGLLHGKVLRSPHAHARILSIDTSKAEAHRDVKAIATSADFAETPPALQQAVLGSPINENLLAKGKVLYKGHPIAAVAATNPHVAEEVLSLIEVEYEVTPLSGDLNGSGIPDECEAAGDLDGDGVVGINDLLLLLGAWGPSGEPCPPACTGDLGGDCLVGIEDFLELLGNWS